jgi:hypothetical protein
LCFRASSNIQVTHPTDETISRKIYCLFAYINKPTTAENTSTSAFRRKPEAATQFERAPDDGHNGARKMLASIYVTKQ